MAQKTDKYKKEGTYLLKMAGGYCRWTSDNALAYFGSKEDALQGLENDKMVEAIRVCDADPEIQKEYELLIDKDYGTEN